MFDIGNCGPRNHPATTEIDRLGQAQAVEHLSAQSRLRILTRSVQKGPASTRTTNTMPMR
jgi:hypothetical protein